MERQRRPIRVSVTRLYMFAALGLAACHGQDATAASDDRARVTASELGLDCVDHQGNKHCPLGGAKLTPSDDGSSLALAGLGSPDDGVAILLPDVTQFSASGAIDPKAGTTLFARSINEGVSTSSMTLTRSNDGFTLSAGFTGSGAGSTYTARLYSGGQVVGEVPGVPSGTAMLLPRPCNFPPPGCRWPAPLPWPPWPPFRVIQSGNNAGACVWTVAFGRGNEVQAALADGKSVIVDAIDLVEDVIGPGSYPYLTFNRIDYTGDAGDARIDGEQLE